MSTPSRTAIHEAGHFIVSTGLELGRPEILTLTGSERFSRAHFYYSPCAWVVLAIAELESAGPEETLRLYGIEEKIPLLISEYQQVRLQVLGRIINGAVAGAAACMGFGLDSRPKLSKEDIDIARKYAALIEPVADITKVVSATVAKLAAGFSGPLAEPTRIVATELDAKGTIRGDDLTALWRSLLDKKLVRPSQISQPDSAVMGWRKWSAGNQARADGVAA